MPEGKRAVRWIDISMPLAKGMPAFPGDPAFDSRPEHSIGRGDPYSVSALSLGSHAGTHVDPPSHFIPGGASIDRVDLAQLNGPVTVIDLSGLPGPIGATEASRVATGSLRVLFRTRNSERWRTTRSFFSDYVALSDEGAAVLLERGVRLVGIDSLSVESDPSGRFPVHHRLLGNGCLILEGLLLGDVAPGTYELRCLPLRLQGGDGGPARAALLAP